MGKSFHLLIIVILVAVQLLSGSSLILAGLQGVNLALRSQLGQNETNLNSLLTCLKTAKNSNICKQCNCDPIGSKSTICDKLTGRCSCKIGYSGAKCNQCSIGYYNITGVSETLKLQTNRSSLSERYCAECGECFNQWHRNIATLKEHSVNAIKHTHELNNLLTTNFKVQLDDKKNNEQENSKNQISFYELDDKIHTIGEKVLANKQNSDRINVLAKELNLTISNLQETKLEMSSRQEENKKLRFDVSKFNYKLCIQKKILDELDQIIYEKYNREQTNVQEKIPRGAFKLIQNHRNRTLLAFSNASGLKNKFLRDLNSITLGYSNKVDSLKKGKRHLDGIGIRILNELTNLYSLNTSSPLSNFFKMLTSEPTIELLDGSKTMRDSAKLLVDEASQKYDNYQSNLDNRTNEMMFAKRLIEETRLAINKTGYKIDEFNLGVSQLLQVIASFNNSESSHDFDQIIENSTQLIRTDLDKVEAKWTSAQLDMTELPQVNLTQSPLANQIFSLSDEINRILERNLPEFHDFKNKIKNDLEGTDELNIKTKTLKDELSEINNNLSNTIEVIGYARATLDQAKLMNTRTDNEVVKLIQSMANLEQDIDGFNNTPVLQQFRESREISRRDYDQQLMVSKVSTNRPRSLHERLKHLQIDLIKRRITSRRLIDGQVNGLTNRNANNERLLVEVSHKYAEVSQCLSAIKNDLGVRHASTPLGKYESPNPPDTAPTGFSGELSPANSVVSADQSGTRIRKLKDHRRAANLITGFNQVSKELYQRLGETYGLKEEFETNEKVFLHKQKVIDSLHVEIGQITADIEKRMRLFQKCEQE